MSSLTFTGTCLWPLCTPNVRPTNCGRIVERRLQILMISLRPDERTFSAFFSRYPSTNGPFQTARVITCLLVAAGYFFFAARPRMMYLSVDLFLRVLKPFVGLP